MNKTIIHLLLWSSVIIGVTGCQSAKTDNKNQEFPELKAGETVSLMDGMKVYVESISGTNLQNVIIYGYDDNDQLKNTAKAESADYTSTENELIINLYNVIIETEDDEGNPKTIEAKLYPIRLNKEVLQLILNEKNANQQVDPIVTTPVG